LLDRRPGEKEEFFDVTAAEGKTAFLCT